MLARNSRFSRALRSSHSEKRCVMYPISRRSSSAWRGMSSPSTRMVPLVGLMSPQSMRIVVDLPDPFGPRKP